MSLSSAPHEEETELRAKFTARSSTILNDASMTEQKTESSPLLSNTPIQVSKVLVRGYPYFVILDKLLSVFTWTNEDGWLSILVVVGYITFVLYFEFFLTYTGHILIAGILVGYSFLSKYVERKITSKPTLDDIIQLLTVLNAKSELFLSPVTSLALTSYDIKRILFTTIFLSPLYVILTFFIFTPRSFTLLIGVFFLSYHSVFSRVSRRILWRFRFVRLLSFYLTGLDFGGININKDSGIFAAVKRVNEKVGIHNKDGKPIVFTYALHENQRRWLGIGWTPNLLSYERTAWTDEFMNEASPTDQFQLPKTEDDSGMEWKWVDKTWRLDLTNDGAIQLSSSRPKTTANPGSDDGFIYYDNTWRKPSTEDSFSKYTRRRRWIRTAELVPTNSKSNASATGAHTSSGSIRIASTTETSSPTAEVTKVEAADHTIKKRKSLRFDDVDQESDLDSTIKTLGKKGRTVSFSNHVDIVEDKPDFSEDVQDEQDGEPVETDSSVVEKENSLENESS